jgi:superfamily II DNA or RNA helicase
VLAGDYAAARAALGRAYGSKRVGLLPGAAGVLEVLLLLRGEASGDLADAERLAGAGARKGNAFRASFSVLKRLAALHGGGRGSWIDVLRPRQTADDDVLLELTCALSALWFKELAADVPFVHAEVLQAFEAVRSTQPTWVCKQYRDVIAALESTKHAEIDRQLKKLGRAPAAVEAEARFPPLRLMFVQKPAWEAALGRLEALALKTGGASEPAKGERLMWRVVPNQSIEPYLQKATPSGWSRGRRLAIKHLLPGSAQRTALPPEDLRVAEYARESVSFSSGYRDVSHQLEPGAWQALVGHPRVFLGDSEETVEVARGQVQLVAQTIGDELRLELSPADVSALRPVRLEGGKLVVYSADKETERVREVVGTALVVPSAQRERALAAAARLTHIVPLQSNELALASARAGDATPYLRLTPRGVGLTAALRVRPLGERGPALAPGEGAPLLMAHIVAGAEQASRDLLLETRLAAEVIEACPMLEGRETGGCEWYLETPDAALELLAVLATLTEKVRVEWPHGKALSLRGRLERSSFRGNLRRAGAEFFLDASLMLDEQLDVPLTDLLRALVSQRGRFVRLEQGDFVELSAELREQLAAIAAARAEDAAAKAGEVMLPPTALAALEGLLADNSGIRLDAPVVKWRDELARVLDGKPRVPRGLNAELRDYQLDGFRWLARLGEAGFGACLADDMGLGKTVQLIALLLHRARTGPALVVAPTSVCDNWLRELARFAPSLSARDYAGAQRAERLQKLGPRDVLVTGYATLQQDAEALRVVAWGTVVLDEAQFIKNASAQRTRAALGLQAGMRVAATGTPVENHAEDLYSLFQFVEPGLLGSATAFRRRFPLSDDSAEGRDSRRNLRKLIQPFLLRRTKAAVLAELPPVTEIEHQVELSREEALLYEAVRRAALEKLSDGEGNKLAVLAELTRLRRLCCAARLVVPEAAVESSKLKAFLELMQELSSAGHRALVFSQFVDVLTLAGTALKGAGLSYQYLDGSCSTKQRTAAVDAFQAGDGDAFLISLKAGGFGLNLTAADYVIHLDPWWNPAAEAQATDRAHRIGQQSPVTVYRLVAKGTIEERIVSLHRSKRELADSLLAESDRAASLSSAELCALLA